MTMRLLFVTQKLDANDSVLGVYHEWVARFAHEFEAITVVCLGKGEVSLPPNVRVLSLGKEEGVSRMTYLRRFYVYIREYKNDYDAVLVHMNPEYAILGSFLWHRWGK